MTTFSLVDEFHQGGDTIFNIRKIQNSKKHLDSQPRISNISINLFLPLYTSENPINISPYRLAEDILKQTKNPIKIKRRGSVACYSTIIEEPEKDKTTQLVRKTLEVLRRRQEQKRLCHKILREIAMLPEYPREGGLVCLQTLMIPVPSLTHLIELSDKDLVVYAQYLNQVYSSKLPEEQWPTLYLPRNLMHELLDL